MKGERGNFKGRVFGGFNRHDVIDYIEKLAAERNGLARENERLRGKIKALEERLEDTETPAREQEDDRRELRDALEEASRVLSGVKSEYDAVCTDIKINATQTDRELKQISSRLTGLRDSLAAAGERLEAIGAALKEGIGDEDSAEHI